MIKIILIAAMCAIYPLQVYATDNMGILADCLPSANGSDFYAPIDTTSYQSLKAGYIGVEPFPSLVEWGACKASYGLKVIRNAKKSEIKAEAMRRAKLIDPDFTESSIAIYRRLKVDALDPNGLSIRAILIYGYQKAQWVITASEQDIGDYDPEADNGWP